MRGSKNKRTRAVLSSTIRTAYSTVQHRYCIAHCADCDDDDDDDDDDAIDATARDDEDEQKIAPIR